MQNGDFGVQVTYTLSDSNILVMSCVDTFGKRCQSRIDSSHA